MKSFPILDLDARLSNQMRVAEKPGALRAIAVFFAHSGDSWFWLLGLLILWLIGNSFWREWAVVQFVGISLLAALVMSIKFLVRRRRPEGEWGGIYRNTDPHSFPSGHAADTFAFATALERHLGWRYAVPAYVFSSYVAISRLPANRHWLSDAVFGSAVGIIAGRTVTSRETQPFPVNVAYVPGGAAIMFTPHLR